MAKIENNFPEGVNRGPTLPADYTMIGQVKIDPRSEFDIQYFTVEADADASASEVAKESPTPVVPLGRCPELDHEDSDRLWWFAVTRISR